ncbi:MAG: tetratricopeptide repeat protein [bacterium]|nr:tetratricopeptide repeat protein [bacterium]
MMILRTISLAFVLALSGLSPAIAQGMLEAQPIAATDSRLTTARQLMKNQNWEAAAAMLEVVYETDTANQTVINLLKNCYGQLKQYGKIETLVSRQIESSPLNISLRLELAEVLADQGMEEKAIEAYRAAEKLITTPDPTRHLLVVRSELRHGLEDEALELIDRLRKQSKDTTLFALERGAVMESRKKYASAISEYLPVLAADTTMEAVEVERRIILLLDFPESSQEVEKLLVAETQTTQNSRVVRLLADYYIRTNRFDQAFTFATKRDSLEKMQGQSLVYLMRQCYDRKLYSEAARFGEWIISRHGGSPSHIEARLYYARSLARIGKTDQAFAQFDTVAARSPRDADRGQAMFEAGDIYFSLLHDYPKALACFDSVISRYPVGMGYVDAQRNRPFCYLRMGDLEAARRTFTFLREHPMTDDLEEESSFHLGLIHLFEGRYDSAETSFRKLLVDHPSGFYINDALQLIMVLTQAKDAPDLLSDYGQALFTQERRAYDSTRIWLDRIARAENNVLADVALYRLTLVNLQMADSAAAMESIERLDSGYTDSYYRPYGLKVKADMLSGSRATVETARSIYKLLLEQFPNYPFASDVRKRLKQIETDFKVG